MKLSQLIYDLTELHVKYGNLEVILQSDTEGNYYNICRGAEYTFYEEDSDTTADCREDAGEDAQEVIVIYP